MNSLPPAKASPEHPASSAIVLSFDSRWEEEFRKKLISCFIRKRLPKSDTPEFMYAYFGSPLSRVFCRAKICSISTISINNALKLAKTLHLTREEIEIYCEDEDQIGLCQISDIDIFPSPIELVDLKKNLRFFPPQSFLILSKEAKQVIDRLANRK